MFRRKSEKSIVHVAEKITSLKEELDALSWSRVSAIAEQLKKGCDEQTVETYAHEMKSIARANISVYNKFGIEAELKTGELLPSGIELLSESSFQDGRPRLERSVCDETPLADEAEARESATEVSDETTEEVLANEVVDEQNEQADEEKTDEEAGAVEEAIPADDTSCEIEHPEAEKAEPADDQKVAVSDEGELGNSSDLWDEAFQKWFSNSEERTFTSK